MVAEQHKFIKGYRDLSIEEINLMNEVKEKGKELGELVSKLESMEGLDKSWIETGKRELQLGLMALTRLIAQPTFF